ncbi:MAG: hypothetical protein ACSLEX_03380 [Minisyncoccota bacterium]
MDTIYFQEIEVILMESNLSETDQALWQDQLAFADEKIQRIFVSIFKNNGEMLRFCTADLRARITAGTDTAQLTDVVEKEREYVRDFLAQI